MVASVLTSVIAYISTNIDDIFVTMILLAQAVKGAKGKLIAGHFLGVGLITVGNGADNVGSVDHPMVAVHWIEWIQLVTEKGSQRKHLNPGEAPKVSFHLGDDKPVAVYAYCNLHGLWKTEMN